MSKLHIFFIILIIFLISIQYNTDQRERSTIERNWNWK
jgi:hypothetical protein